MRTLSAHRKVSLVSLAAITTNFHQAFDVEADHFPQIAFYLALFLDDAAKLGRFFLGQILSPFFPSLFLFSPSKLNC